jgi:serine palmitoyltransferase
MNTTLEYLSYSLESLETGFYKIPGSQVLARYVKSSHQNDPGRTLLEVILLIFAIRTLLQSRTRADNSSKHFIQFSEKVHICNLYLTQLTPWLICHNQEIDELVDEWIPEPLEQPLSERENLDLASLPVISGSIGPKPKLEGSGKTVVNLASFNFTGLAGNEHIKQKATEALRKYGLGSCGPAGFYGTIDVHTDLERSISDFLGTEDAILYSQAFSTVSSVIPAFSKRGDIIVADRNINFAIQKGLQISRSTIRWFDHNDMKSLEEVLESINKESRKRRAPLTRRFIITEGIFERDGSIADLPKLVRRIHQHHEMMD